MKGKTLGIKLQAVGFKLQGFSPLTALSCLSSVQITSQLYNHHDLSEFVTNHDFAAAGDFAA